MSCQKAKNLMPCMIDFSSGDRCHKLVMLACQICWQLLQTMTLL